MQPKLTNVSKMKIYVHIWLLFSYINIRNPEIIKLNLRLVQDLPILFLLKYGCMPNLWKSRKLNSISNKINISIGGKFKEISSLCSDL